jgi:RNA polymerase sigma-70 factor (ECF subfamily)
MDDTIADRLESLHPDAFGWALHCCGGDRDSAEDVLQNAYLKVASGRVHFAGRSTFKTWWFGVIRLTALEERRRRRSLETLVARLVAAFTPDAPQQRTDPSRQVELGDEAARLRTALKKLPARQAETLHLVFYQGLSLEEAAAVMRIGVGSVRQHYDRGKTRLRDLLRSPSNDE